MTFTEHPSTVALFMDVSRTDAFATLPVGAIVK